MKIHDVFTPNDIPTVTYVDRTEHRLEQTLLHYFNTPNIVISVSGPSKSGKTVLIKKIVEEDHLISVLGAGITSPDNLWQRVLNWMGSPTHKVVTKSSSSNLTASLGGGGKIGVPLFAQGSASGSLGAGKSSSESIAETIKEEPLPQVIREIGDSDFVIFIDDFHYIDPSFQTEIGRQIKVAAENGVKIITASVPHRADDVVRSNPELRGRVGAVDITNWTMGELEQIARKGFAALNLELSSTVIQKLSTEAFGSPQLMQTICLNLCFSLNVKDASPELRALDVDETTITEALLGSSGFANFSKMLTSLHTGPRTRGTERNRHDLIDGTRGDVYRAILLGIQNDPAELSFPYENVMSRVRSICKGEAPAGSSVTSALEQMHAISEEVQPGTSPLFWDGDALEITDPYFLFYLRCSEKLKQLAR